MRIEQLRKQRREALQAAREAHPADISIYVAIARQAHARIMRDKLGMLGRGPLENVKCTR